MTPAGHPVLLVDDDPGVRRTLARFLGRDGIAIVEADNGQQALTYLQSGGGASVIVLDLRMPVMDGFQFREEQRRDSSLAGIPVVVLSGADTDRFDGYSVLSWTDGDGRPLGNVYAIAQTADGYLWIGSDSGLLRFDGARFTQWESLSTTSLPKVAVTALSASPDGTLWVGFAEP